MDIQADRTSALLGNKQQWRHIRKCLCGRTGRPLLGIRLGRAAVLVLHFWDATTLISTNSRQRFLFQHITASICRHLLSWFLEISFLDFVAVYTQVRWNFNEALICDSLVATDISHFNTRLLGICTSLEDCLLRSLCSFLSPSPWMSSVCISLYVLGISVSKHALFRKSEEA